MISTIASFDPTARERLRLEAPLKRLDSISNNNLKVKKEHFEILRNDFYKAKQDFMKYSKPFKPYKGPNGYLSKALEDKWGKTKSILKMVSDFNSNLDEWQEALANRICEKQHITRSRQMRERLKLEIELAYHNNSFVLFDTLTATDELINEVFEPHSKHWDNYRKWFKRNTRNHRHFAVVEKGKKFGRLHIHVIHIFDGIKFKPICPNKYNYFAKTDRIVSEFNIWTCGLSTPIAIRFCKSDAWGELGHCWPEEYDKHNQLKPIESTIPGQLANYLGDYIFKSRAAKKELNKWRTKTSPNFGTMILKKMLPKLKLKHLQILTNNPLVIQTIIPTWISRLPMQTIVKEAIRVRMNMIRFLKPKSALRIELRLATLPGLLKQLNMQKDMMAQLTTTDLRSTNFGNTKARIFKNTDIFDLLTEILHIQNSLFWKPTHFTHGN